MYFLSQPSLQMSKLILIILLGILSFIVILLTLQRLILLPIPLLPVQHLPILTNHILLHHLTHLYLRLTLPLQQLPLRNLPSVDDCVDQVELLPRHILHQPNDGQHLHDHHKHKYNDGRYQPYHLRHIHLAIDQIEDGSHTRAR